MGGAPLTYDAAGNLTGDGTATYTWNNAGRLQQVNTGSTTVSFTYDALGRRSSKTVNGTTETYHFDGGRVAYVTDASGTVLRRFTYADDGRPLYMGQGGTLYYYHTNAHGDVVSLTDASGNVVARYENRQRDPAVLP